MAQPSFYQYSGAFIPGTLARAEQVGVEYTSIQTGFAKLAYQGVDSGAAGAYIITTSGGQCGSYTDGLTIEAKLLNGNTTSCTIAVDSGATVGLTQPNGQSLASGALVANNWYRMMYNSTYSAWTVISPTPATTITSNTISAAAPTNKVGLVAAGGVSTACVPIDATYALDQTIAPTMTGAWTFNNTVTFGSTVSFTTGLTLTAVANAYALILNTLSTVGSSKGLQINAGTNASDICAQFNNQSGTLNLNILGEGSVVVGAATGGGQGRGSINAQALYVNGVAVLTSSASGANPTAKVGTSAVNGSATTFMRSDGAPPIDQTIAPTWTGAHVFTPSGSVVAVTINGAVNQHCLQVTGATNTSSGSYVARFFSAQGVGFSNGVWINAGTNSSDNALLVETAAGSPLLSINGAGAVVVTPAAGTTALQLKPGNSASVGLDILDPGANATELRLNTNNTTIRYQSAGGAANLDFETSSAVQFRIGSGGNSILGKGATNGLTDMTPDQGTFTLTLTGFSSAQTVTAIWTRVGNLVMLFIPAKTGTSNATSMTATGTPAEIQPARAQGLAIANFSLVDVAAAITSPGCSIATNGTITFGNNAPSGGFTASGTKGVNTNGALLCWLLN